MSFKKKVSGLALLLVLCIAVIADAASIDALLVTGQSNPYHKWQNSSPILRQILEQTGKFKVDVAKSPKKGGDMKKFKPNFEKYDVIIVDYDGNEWSEKTKKAFVKYMKSGGGAVFFHAACNAFPRWKEYNEITGLGGWSGRNEKSGPMI